MKKFISLLLVLILALALVACGGGNEQPEPAPSGGDQPSGNTEPEATPLRVCYVVSALGDNSFADSCG